MKITRFFFVVATLLLIVTNVIVGLLTNYASTTIPQILRENTGLIWALIGLGSSSPLFCHFFKRI